ncbi:MAG: hypothetical protein CVV64_10110 [Candidatus Wallbacteria bacterium HGW-Wallbacteria-1]|uniref:Nitroreductase domain-containing protein n=1 Tax=Candidatus Wallbacteria bacterium HGW-Wallbacteria-1 TaxID=2013854 RepID=A0A2N1PPQ6_9BACT|nr:MAG: hypothetical protein CVV64_10110 [Candidatus Wallbacteria bacterium HGW-Wallbacteria-1]
MKEIEILEHVMSSRRSIRKYSSEPVSRDLIERVMKAAILAPSGQNRQPWDFHILMNRSIILNLAEIVRRACLELRESVDKDKLSFFDNYSCFFDFFRDAPAVIAVFARPYTPISQLVSGESLSEKIVSVNDTTHIQSVSSAVTNLILAASSLGLGTCWNTNCVLASSEIREFLNVRMPWEFISLVSIGWPAENPSPTRRFQIEKVVHFHE